MKQIYKSSLYTGLNLRNTIQFANLLLKNYAKSKCVCISQVKFMTFRSRYMHECLTWKSNYNKITLFISYLELGINFLEATYSKDIEGTGYLFLNKALLHWPFCKIGSVELFRWVEQNSRQKIVFQDYCLSFFVLLTALEASVDK